MNHLSNEEIGAAVRVIFEARANHNNWLIAYNRNMQESVVALTSIISESDICKVATAQVCDWLLEATR